MSIEPTWCEDLLRIVQKHRDIEEKLEKIFYTLDELETIMNTHKEEESNNG